MLARFEQLMEQAIEGSLRRVFSTSLQPIQLAKAAARAMEQAEVIGVHGAEVPNVYELQLAAADLNRFGEYRQTLASEVRTYLEEYARERGLRPVAEIEVSLQEDAAVRPGSVRARARFVGLAPEVQQHMQRAVEGTRRLRLADLAAATPPRTRPAQVELSITTPAGVRFPLDPRVEVVRLGRATDNDVVVESPRVSRYHCQLRWVQSSWLAYDLESTNGTWLDNQRLEQGRPRLLQAGSRLRLGDVELKVQGTRSRRRGPD
jgi:hypothetical protein